ncbi:MAG: very short patch repair endonuclease [Candidatus Liptonbacteria bacterium]|nr:very short patch repair endonuclease [Candidatus Liptonbacteria bacterium]
MTDVLTKKQRSYNMSRIKAENTGPEIKLRKLLSGKGFKNYRVNYSNLPGKPDIVFVKKHVVVFTDGCFWHKCPICFTKPKTSIKFWAKKIQGNLKRDKKVNRELKKKGWLVIRLWEHDLERNSNQILSKLVKILKR